MKTPNFKITIFILFATLSFTLSGQIVNPKISTLKKTSTETTPRSSKANADAMISICRAFGTSNEYLVSATNCPLSQAPALGDFRLWYNNGDHKVRTIGILHEQGSLLAKYSDQNGDDPFHVEANFINVPGATGGTISAAGSGTFNIQLPTKPANTTLVISGFLFERLSGTDNNIRTMSIKMDQENSLAQVSFIDDQREDYRSVDANAIVSGSLLVVPFGTIISTALSLEQIAKAAINEGKNTARPYAITLQYAFIPNSRVFKNGSLSGTSRGKGLSQGQLPTWTTLAYRAFVLRFNNSDHHILGVGIHLNGMATFPGQRGFESDAITWQDNNTDDPIQWLVDYSELK